jgi:hypothetical protein
MIYKNSKEYKETVKNLNDALLEGAHKAKQESELQKPGSQPNKPVKSEDQKDSE